MVNNLQVKMNSKRPTPRHIIIQSRERTRKQAERSKLSHTRTLNKIIRFSSETLESENGRQYHKVLKKKLSTKNPISRKTVLRMKKKLRHSQINKAEGVLHH